MSRLIRIGEPVSSPKWRDNQRWVWAIASVTATPSASPARAIHRKVPEADTIEKLPVSAAATAKRKQTRPEASFNNDSPSRICISRFGIGQRATIEDTATGSVGDTTAASANATASGIPGIIQ
ncbi:hypothetical protein FACS1894154_01800 [Betaproteobacteria bacterium]|nr:hypothetical protein FACS1894154_01800 [Betaproteobacteria bacterium]